MSLIWVSGTRKNRISIVGLLKREPVMKIPVFCLDADDGMGHQAIGTAADMAVTEANLLGNLQVALDTLENGDDGDRVTLILTRCDMAVEEVFGSPRPWLDDGSLAGSRRARTDG